MAKHAGRILLNMLQKHPKYELCLSEDQSWPCSAGWLYLCRN